MLITMGVICHHIKMLFTVQHLTVADKLLTKASEVQEQMANMETGNHKQAEKDKYNKKKTEMLPACHSVK